ncbi:hypothetical protein DOY81_013594, partial [Sarcophaga bullata]
RKLIKKSSTQWALMSAGRPIWPAMNYCKDLWSVGRQQAPNVIEIASHPSQESKCQYGRNSTPCSIMTQCAKPYPIGDFKAEPKLWGGPTESTTIAVRATEHDERATIKTAPAAALGRFPS